MVRHILRIGLSIAVSLLILALLLQLVTSGLPAQERPSVLTALQNTSMSLVMAYGLLSLIALFVRAYRYRLLIQLSGSDVLPTIGQMAIVTGIRNMVVDLLPARLGELGYVGLLNRGYGVKLQHCISSLTIAIAFDFVAVLVVIALIVGKQLFGGDLQGWALAAMLSALVLSLVALAGLFVITPWFNRLVQQRSGSVSTTSLWGKGLSLLDDFSKSLQAVGQARKSILIVLLSVGIRLLKYAGMYLLFLAVALPNFDSLNGIPMEHTIGALIGGEIGASMPIPTFMSFGAYEAGSALVFQLLGVADQAAAVVTMLCVHIWSQCMDYLLGGTLLALFIFLVRRAKTESPLEAADSGLTIKSASTLALAAGALIVSSGFLGYQLWAASKLGSLTPPPAGAADIAGQSAKERSRAELAGLQGFVVFSSNRDGNHDIFKLDLASFELTKLTNHPHTETYPRVSFDGTRVIFSRAHQDWVSQRNTVAWDIYLLDLVSGTESKLASNATAPEWISNNEIAYLQSGQNVMRLNVETLKEAAVLIPGLHNSLPKNASLQNPSVNGASGEVSFTGRQSDIGSPHGHWGTALVDGTGNKKIVPILEGCELRWRRDGTSLFQVTKGGRDNDLRIVSVSPDSLKIEPLIDLAGEFSHEYWPIESNDGRYIVFGASRGKKDHEHDVADYEIFLWKHGSDPSTATRLTFHTGNDNWPSVYIQQGTE
ncbi:lysylphosphatidylglycerol synthase domain-containing protein [Arenicella xantha]|uniref:Uncharacterized membrane protein YbhN (UPF0104 family) n=1 Tax=Arenicella xantha TaxID=644221 RepID=A0A395JKP2_9GAMM|nr:lysylphosphatidylglycerol synthase domain-containing protein [Arenicella xantha]RBP49622.1 uncharacterized membrane protein YbhN (UPF0104 family) [Arenicella xantha]